MNPYEFRHSGELDDAPDGFDVEWAPAAGCVHIVLNRPPLNIVSMGQRDQLASVFAALGDDDDVRVIVLRSAGDNFSSGGDISGFLEASPERVSDLAWNVAAPERCPKPVIAAIRGYCFGVGFELALACDFRIAGTSAVFALPEMRIGMIPGSGGSARLIEMIGIARAKEIAMRGRRIPAELGCEWGFVSECTADDSLDGAVSALCDELSAFSPLAQRTLKRVMNRGQHLPLEGAIALEGEAYGRLRSSDDFREGVASFNEKRRPAFRGS